MNEEILRRQMDSLDYEEEEKQIIDQYRQANNHSEMSIVNVQGPMSNRSNRRANYTDNIDEVEEVKVREVGDEDMEILNRNLYNKKNDSMLNKFGKGSQILNQG